MFQRNQKAKKYNKTPMARAVISHSSHAFAFFLWNGFIAGLFCLLRHLCTLFRQIFPARASKVDINAGGPGDRPLKTH
jgi:hypothetical protein